MRLLLAILISIGVIAAPGAIRSLPNGFQPPNPKSESLEDVLERTLIKLGFYEKPERKNPPVAEKNSEVVSTVMGPDGKPRAPNVPISVISISAANSLFKEFQDNKNIPFRYPREGCFARATEMSRMAEAAGITMARIYVEGNLQVKTDLPRYPTVNWKWHVAPIAYVTQEDGSTELMVFDPGLFNRPVTQGQWLEKMQYTTAAYTPRISNVYYGNRYQLFNRKWESARSTWDPRLLEISQQVLTKFRSLQEPEPISSRKAAAKGGIN